MTRLAWISSSLFLLAFSLAHADTPPTYQGRWGGMGTANGQFNVPRGVAVDPWGDIYVADYNNQRIQKFDALGSFIKAWGSFGSDTSQFIGPWDIAVSKVGNLYVVEAGQDRVQEFTRNGLYIRQWGSPGTAISQFQTPAGIDIGSNGGVYISERVGDRIQEFDLNGAFIRAWGSLGTGDGQFNVAADVAVGNDGSVYVTDVFNDRIEKFDSTGTFITKWDWSLIGTPGSMAVDAQGNLLVTDTSNHRIVKLDTNGSVLTTFGSSGNGPGQFMAPEKIGVATSGYIYVSDSQLHFVSMFAPAGVDAGPPATGRFAVYGSVPEPITSQGDIRFSLPHAALVTVAVYDVAGHLVRGLCRDRFESTGDHEIAWDREDDHGRRVAAGVYQVLIRAESFSGTKKVVVIG